MISKCHIIFYVAVEIRISKIIDKYVNTLLIYYKYLVYIKFTINNNDIKIDRSLLIIMNIMNELTKIF